MTISSALTQNASQWKKKGLIVRPERDLWWMRTHAMVPVAEHVKDDIYRIYFSGRDHNNHSSIGYATVDLNNPNDLLSITSEPILLKGELGCFDDSGVTPSWVVNHQGDKYLYYIGWNRSSSVRMNLIAGLAILGSGEKNFIRHSKAPILDRTPVDPYALNTAPCVLVQGNLWRMWYVSCVGWVHRDLPRYVIKYAESRDGIRWRREGKICINFKSDSETAIARPCVLEENGIYKMWYAYKRSAYRIGYAESIDGIDWARKDELAGIDVSPVGWDSEMIEYAYVFHHKGQKHMLYNGNHYGKEGIGYAVCESS